MHARRVTTWHGVLAIAALRARVEMHQCPHLRLLRVGRVGLQNLLQSLRWLFNSLHHLVRIACDACMKVSGQTAGTAEALPGASHLGHCAQLRQDGEIETAAAQLYCHGLRARE